MPAMSLSPSVDRRVQAPAGAGLTGGAAAGIQLAHDAPGSSSITTNGANVPASGSTPRQSAAVGPASNGGAPPSAGTETTAASEAGGTPPASDGSSEPDAPCVIPREAQPKTIADTSNRRCITHG